MRILYRYAVAFALPLLAGCAGASTTRVAGESRDRIVLVHDDARTQMGGNLFDLIRRERPHWLEVRGPGTMGATRNQGSIIVYQDGVRLGLLESLRDIRVEIVAGAQFVGGPEATTRFGLDHQYGAILVETRRTQ